MAITYKSAGAGVATETSGAALSPACPATVDAGDILILQTAWEGTSSAPSPPGDWTLLGSSPYDVGTGTVVARHWVYGKIADGSEDGATVALGSPAVTTQRSARIFSFAGRVSGTITQVVPNASFSGLAGNTDPTGPTVTTTKAGALACALVFQNDNNTLETFEGSSDTWTERGTVGGYIYALNPGGVQDLLTATPAADPGTVSGGAMTVFNDPWSVIGFEIRDSNLAATPINVNISDSVDSQLADTLIAIGIIPVAFVDSHTISDQLVAIGIIPVAFNDSHTALDTVVHLKQNATKPWDTFDSYSVGSSLEGASGGRSWSTNWDNIPNTGWTVQIPPFGGQGGLAARKTGTGSEVTGRVFSGLSIGRLHFEALISAVPTADQFVGLTLSDGSDRMLIKFASNGQIQIYDNSVGGYVNIQAFSVNTWYAIDIDFNDTSQNNLYRARINGGDWTSYKTVLGGSYTTIDRIFFKDTHTTEHDFWIDDVRMDVEMATPINASFSENVSSELQELVAGQHRYVAQFGENLEL